MLIRLMLFRYVIIITMTPLVMNRQPYNQSAREHNDGQNSKQT